MRAKRILVAPSKNEHLEKAKKNKSQYVSTKKNRRQAKLLIWKKKKSLIRMEPFKRLVRRIIDEEQCGLGYVQGGVFIKLALMTQNFLNDLLAFTSILLINSKKKKCNQIHIKTSVLLSSFVNTSTLSTVQLDSLQ